MKRVHVYSTLSNAHSTIVRSDRQHHGNEDVILHFANQILRAMATTAAVALCSNSASKPSSFPAALGDPMGPAPLCWVTTRFVNLHSKPPIHHQSMTDPLLPFTSPAPAPLRFYAKLGLLGFGVGMAMEALLITSGEQERTCFGHGEVGKEANTNRVDSTDNVLRMSEAKTLAKQRKEIEDFEEWGRRGEGAARVGGDVNGARTTTL
ncbi:hypothetical protein HK101_001060 [Irineochytrium annulatum]|nr:hypothetical protein HK101_001060 [Irineochytrium annulatum]